MLAMILQLCYQVYYQILFHQINFRFLSVIVPDTLYNEQVHLQSNYRITDFENLAY